MQLPPIGQQKEEQISPVVFCKAQCVVFSRQEVTPYYILSTLEINYKTDSCTRFFFALPLKSTDVGVVYFLPVTLVQFCIFCQVEATILVLYSQELVSFALSPQKVVALAMSCFLGMQILV